MVLYMIFILSSLVTFPIYEWIDNHKLKSMDHYIGSLMFYFVIFAAYSAIGATCFYLLANISTFGRKMVYSGSNSKKNFIQVIDNEDIESKKNFKFNQNKYRSLKVALFLFLILLAFLLIELERVGWKLYNIAYAKYIFEEILLCVFLFLTFFFLYTKVFYRKIKRPSVLP